MKARVVIIDDRPTNLRIYAQFVKLMGDGYQVNCFENPVRALEFLDQEQADLLIVDYRMPEMTGAEFIRRVRAMPAGGEVPAIVITAHQDRECRIAALDAGATDFLQSPVSQAEFKERSLHLLEQRKRKKELAARADSMGRSAPREIGDRSTESAKSMLEQIIDTIPIMINAIDKDGKCLFLNAYQAAMYDRLPNELVGRDVYSMTTTKLAERERRRDSIVLKTGEPLPHYEERISKDGLDFIFHCNKNPLKNREGEAIGILTTAVDITARKFAEEHRTHLALHDILTGLPNRALLGEHLEQALGESAQGSESAALLLLDLDRFKIINDTRGHQTGDILLREVAGRLDAFLQPDEIAARIGGDEFALVLRNLKNVDEINSRCAALLREINRPYQINGVEQVVGASIGIALLPGDGDDADELLRLADLAMYDAKSRGRNGFCFFSPELNRIAQFNAQTEMELREAIVLDQFELEYQPVVSLETEDYVGVEALIRWNHPTRGRLLPKDFLTVANDSGMMDAIGKWVIEAACKQIVSLRDQGIRSPRISVNVSPRQFQTQDVVKEIVTRLEKYDIEPDLLCIEITEEVFLERNAEILEALAQLRSLGINISIDDFGTGYSSLQYLRDLPATRLKIDRAFVCRITESSVDRAIISTISHLAHALKMKVVAEGVETQAQFDLLQAAGCDEVQGWLTGRPMPSAKLAHLLTHSDERKIWGTQP
ncbi:EAL domain-containing response regulator [Novosphingopyxis baekryungensis]|uniref:EAL domain-containing response regulator n=1 Tax=Novosphingopyxis baekryungensis TaxID=279369 RepID=UPI0003B5FA97|nr:EAL domain-containing protein [Novosphingopyxis baekryungensis]